MYVLIDFQLTMSLREFSPARAERVGRREVRRFTHRVKKAQPRLAQAVESTHSERGGPFLFFFFFFHEWAQEAVLPPCRASASSVYGCFLEWVH